MAESEDVWDLIHDIGSDAYPTLPRPAAAVLDGAPFLWGSGPGTTSQVGGRVRLAAVARPVVNLFRACGRSHRSDQCAPPIGLALGSHLCPRTPGLLCRAPTHGSQTGSSAGAEPLQSWRQPSHLAAAEWKGRSWGCHHLGRPGRPPPAPGAGCMASRASRRPAACRRLPSQRSQPPT